MLRSGETTVCRTEGGSALSSLTAKPSPRRSIRASSGPSACTAAGTGEREAIGARLASGEGAGVLVCDSGAVTTGNFIPVDGIGGGAASSRQAAAVSSRNNGSTQTGFIRRNRHHSVAIIFLIRLWRWAKGCIVPQRFPCARMCYSRCAGQYFRISAAVSASRSLPRCSSCAATCSRCASCQFCPNLNLAVSSSTLILTTATLFSCPA